MIFGKLINRQFDISSSRIFPILFVVMFLVAIPGCLIAYFEREVEETVHYRLVYKIENKGRVFTSSSVLQIRCFEHRRVGGCSLRGETFPVWVSNEEFVFPLLGSKYGESNLPQRWSEAWKILTANFKSNNRDSDRSPGFVDTISRYRLEKPAMDISLETSPVLVYFRDLQNPETIEIVDPANALIATNVDFRIAFIRIEFTDDPIPKSRIVDLMPWLDLNNGHEFVRPKSIHPFRLSRRHFISD